MYFILELILSVVFVMHVGPCNPDPPGDLWAQPGAPGGVQAAGRSAGLAGLTEIYGHSVFLLPQSQMQCHEQEDYALDTFHVHFISLAD